MFEVVRLHCERCQSRFVLFGDGQPHSVTLCTRCRNADNPPPRRPWQGQCKHCDMYKWLGIYASNGRGRRFDLCRHCEEAAGDFVDRPDAARRTRELAIANRRANMQLAAMAVKPWPDHHALLIYDPESAAIRRAEVLHAIIDAEEDHYNATH